MSSFKVVTRNSKHSAHLQEMLLHFANDWKSETGDTASELVLEKKMNTKQIGLRKCKRAVFMATHSTSCDSPSRPPMV